MRILHVVPYFAPAFAYGGPPTSVSQLCRALVGRRHEVTVLTTDALTSTTRQRERHITDGLDIHYLRNLSNYLAWNHQLFLPIGTRRFLRKKMKDFDVVHVHMYRTYQNVLVHGAHSACRTPYVFSAHGSLPRIVRKQLAKSVFDSLYGNRFLKDAAKVVALTNAEQRQYEMFGVPSEKITIIPNGIDLDDFRFLPSAHAFIRRYNLQDKKIVTYVGRLNKRKGLDTLVRSFKSLSSHLNNVALLLIGPDEGYGETLRKLVKEVEPHGPVVMTGLITMPEKLEAYSASDVVVYPGAYEIFGLVPFEALMCGKPVVVSDDSGCGELIASAQAGFVVPYGDSENMETAILRAIEGGEEVRRMVERGQHFVRTALDWNRIAASTEIAYRDVCAEARGGSNRKGSGRETAS